MADVATVLWRHQNQPGHECATLYAHGGDWFLRGTALLAYDGAPCRLDYEVRCDAAWATRSARVTGFVGDHRIMTTIEAIADGSWRLNGERIDAVSGCIDVDLNFSPSTNLLPIRRLNLHVGDAAAVQAAWLRFPGFTLERLEQTYRRTGATTYRYESGSGFAADLEVSASGLPLRYGDFWVAEAASHRPAPG